MVFDLGDDLDVLTAVGVQVLTHGDHVFLLTDEGGRDEVNALLATEDQVSLVLFSQSRQGGLDVRQVNTLILAQGTVVQNLTDHFLIGNGSNFQTDQTIVDQYSVTNLQILGETSIGHSHTILVTNNSGVGGEGEGLACNQIHIIAAFELDGTDFGTLGIQQDGTLHTGFGTDSAHVLDAVAMLFVVTVGEVQTHDVHAGVQQFGQHFLGFGLRTDGADDLGLFHRQGLRLMILEFKIFLRAFYRDC